MKPVIYCDEHKDTIFPALFGRNCSKCKELNEVEE